ncbi:hypothetical protein BCR36DRAFT_584875 [Piromyces finnis]|uniref:Uncharacterized protein n=1 Tax=Piromyces finnis TaxID=1754191 RepID=A0A1Y1V536_9FUNG|nr:hypothetical protein BCR36DRAFT_584875 [Piromyces finnis]|eukprot:ORX47369.1 hypothetical protein BCR36DRAFT_584875 [Piromyces finnis]
MLYFKTFIAFFLSVLIKVAFSESNCGTSLCISTNVIKPGEPVALSWHKSDNPTGLQISLLYGDNSDKTDCHELQSQHVLRSWKLNHGEEEYSITINDVDFDIEGKTFVFLVEYLTSNFCMMAPAGPKGLGTSYVIFDDSMPVKKPETNESTTINNASSTNGSDSKTDNDNANSNSNASSNNKDKDKDSSADNNNKTENSSIANSNGANNVNNEQTGNNKDNNATNTDNDTSSNKEISDDGNSISTSGIISIIIGGVILLILACCLLVYCSKKLKGKDKNSNADSLKQNSTTRMLPTLMDDAFAEDSVYSAVNIDYVMLGPSINANENFIPNVSVESFNSTTSQSGLISRNEAKMIAERFRCELQNPLNNEADDTASIKDKKDETV